MVNQKDLYCGSKPIYKGSFKVCSLELKDSLTIKDKDNNGNDSEISKGLDVCPECGGRIIYPFENKRQECLKSEPPLSLPLTAQNLRDPLL